MTFLSLGQCLMNDSPCTESKKTEPEGDTGQLLQKADFFFFCHIRAKTRAHSNLRELAFALYCSELLSMLNVRANVVFLSFLHPSSPTAKVLF